MNKKKYPTGFAPVDFSVVGKVFLIIGFFTLFLGFGNTLLKIFHLPINLIAVGLVFGFVGLYLVFVVPKE